MRVLLGLAVLNIALHAAALNRYGYHRDELYFLDCASHLDFGYVDHPPLLEYVIAPTRALLGDSLIAIRIPALLMSTAVVLLTALITRQLGGTGFAQLLAGLAAMLAPAYLATSSMISVEGLNTLFWVLALYLVVLILKEPAGPRWLALGVVLGAGFLAKYAMAFLAVGLGVGLLLSRERTLVRSRWPWLAAAAGAIVCLPNFLWQWTHQWPFLSYARKIHASMMQWIPLHLYLIFQMVFIGFAGILLALAGLAWLLFAEPARRFRMLGLAFVAVLVLLVAVGSKPYYPAPAYAVLLAAGAVAFERLAEGRRRRVGRIAAVAVIVLAGLIALPYSLPILPLDQFLAYSRIFHVAPAFTFETGRRLPLPQHFADMFGWEHQVETLAGVYAGLDEVEKPKTVFFAENYGEAGAVNLFGRRYGLPRAISGHFSYYFWGPGPPGTQVVITVGGTKKADLDRCFEDVRLATRISHPFAIFYENNIPVYVCRRPRMTLEQLWPGTKSF
jgi:hypothetical protein